MPYIIHNDKWGDEYRHNVKFYRIPRKLLSCRHGAPSSLEVAKAARREYKIPHDDFLEQHPNVNRGDCFYSGETRSQHLANALGEPVIFWKTGSYKIDNPIELFLPSWRARLARALRAVGKFLSQEQARLPEGARYDNVD